MLLHSMDLIEKYDHQLLLALLTPFVIQLYFNFLECENLISCLFIKLILIEYRMSWKIWCNRTSHKQRKKTLTLESPRRSINDLSPKRKKNGESYEVIISSFHVTICRSRENAQQLGRQTFLRPPLSLHVRLDPLKTYVCPPWLADDKQKGWKSVVYTTAALFSRPT